MVCQPMIEKELEPILSAFDARIVSTINQAADQDGYDGGYLACTATAEAWGETPEAAKENLHALIGQN